MAKPSGKVVPYEEAEHADLFVEAVYCGSNERQQDALPPCQKPCLTWANPLQCGPFR